MLRKIVVGSDVGKAQERGDGLLVDRIVEARIDQERLEFGAEDQRAVRPSVIQRLFSSRSRANVKLRVDRSHNANANIPQTRSSAICTPHDATAARRSLGVRMAAPRRRGVLIFEPSPQVQVVVNLAVESNDETSRIMLHGLRARRREIENREPPVPKRDTTSPSIHSAPASGPAMPDSVGHTADNASSVGVGPPSRKPKSCYAAHTCVSSL